MIYPRRNLRERARRTSHPLARLFAYAKREPSKQITKETTKFRNASAAGEMVDGRWVRLGAIRAVSPTQEVTSGCRVPSRPLFATRTTRVASRLLPTHPPTQPTPSYPTPKLSTILTVNPSADLQNAAACRDRLPTVCDSYVRNRRVLTGCDLVIEMLDRRIRINIRGN